MPSGEGQTEVEEGSEPEPGPSSTDEDEEMTIIDDGTEKNQPPTGEEAPESEESREEDSSRFGTLGREWRDQVEEEAPAASSEGAGEAEAEGSSPRTNGSSPHSTASPSPGDVPPASDLGERAELERALELLDELIELDPGNPALYRRKAKYARRLGDGDNVAGALREWARVLEGAGEWRSAHFLFQRSLEMEPGHRPSREALDRVLFEDGAGPGADGRKAAVEPASEGSPGTEEDDSGPDWSDPGDVLRAELGRATEEVYRLQSAALRLLESRQGSRDEVDARQAACEILGRYYVARQAYGRAAKVLLPILTRTGIWDEDRKDTLYLCGFSFHQLDEEERAGECFERLAKVDESFKAVLRNSGAELPSSGEA